MSFMLVTDKDTDEPVMINLNRIAKIFPVFKSDKTPAGTQIVFGLDMYMRIAESFNQLIKSLKPFVLDEITQEDINQLLYKPGSTVMYKEKPWILAAVMGNKCIIKETGEDEKAKKDGQELNTELKYLEAPETLG